MIELKVSLILSDVWDLTIMAINRPNVIIFDRRSGPCITMHWQS